MRVGVRLLFLCWWWSEKASGSWSAIESERERESVEEGRPGIGGKVERGAGGGGGRREGRRPVPVGDHPPNSCLCADGTTREAPGRSAQG